MEPVELEGPDACLAFLILNQDEWQPTINIQDGYHNNEVPVTLVGKLDEEL